MSSPTAKAALLASAFERNVLLLDGRESRQLARAAAMRQSGATVQCVATGAAARAVGKPGSHQLVIIELEGAGADARQFYDYARAQSPEQAFAFYIKEPPYLASTPDGGAPHAASEKAPRQRVNGSRWNRSLQEASRKMTVVRSAARAEAGSHSSPSFGDAVKAAEAQAEAEAEQEARFRSEPS